MTDNLRAAAELIHETTASDWTEPYTRGMETFWEVKPKMVQAANKLAAFVRAYLAGRSEDDGEPVTCQRLVDAGFSERRSTGRDKHRYFGNGPLEMKQEHSGGIPVRWRALVAGATEGIKTPETMGQVRRFIAALKGE